jgi:ABC-type polysaccharide/polyol phosphate export permease
MSALARGFAECIDGLRNWRMSHLFGIAELRRRYSRSTLGQMWLTLSTALTATMLALVWTVLWRSPPAEILPHIVVGLVLWTFLTSIMTEASQLPTAVAQIKFNQRVAFSTFVYGLIYRNLIVLAHNALIVLGSMLLFPAFSWINVWLFFPALFLVSICGFFVATIIGYCCARFRDLPHVIASILQLGLYLTPVLWLPRMLPEGFGWILMVNPFTHFLEIMRQPLVGEPIVAAHWVFSFAITVLMGFFATLLAGRWRDRLVYWL